MRHRTEARLGQSMSRDATCRNPFRTAEPLRIALLVPGFPSDVTDTNCLPYLQNYVEALRTCGHDPAVFSFQVPPRSERYVWKGVPVYPAGGDNRSGLTKAQTWTRIFRTVLRRRDVDVLHSFWLGECALVGQALSRVHRCAHVVSIGGREVRWPTAYSRLLRPGRFLLTAGSEHAARDAAVTLGREADAIIPLGLDLERMPSVDPASARDVDVLAVGSLLPMKRFDVVVEVASRLREDFPELTICIAGDGPERESIRRAVVSRGLGSRLRLLGSLPREEVLQWMVRSKILLHPSEYESQGYVFLEALAAGAYVVCRDVGWPGSGEKVVRCASEDEMAAAVRHLLRSERDHAPVPVPTATDTVRAFENVYARAMGSAARV